ncbi:hypothetical protein DRQ25_06755 [Candidatus Fermentibacteria bacterium]|nr:MAG: hypothetical protein DRQ25_06755 [Candidatus Fermentibacteria bacterium]
MRFALFAVVLVAVLGSSTQIVYMDLDKVLPMAGSVLIARVVSLETEECDRWCSANFSLIIMEMIRGSADTDAEISCSYHLNLPRSCDSAMGTVTWVSPLETGSGYEFFVSVGDTVIVLLDADYAEAAGNHTLLRIEPLDMIEQLLGEMDNTVLGGLRNCQTDQVIQLGSVYTHDFIYSGERWRSQELIELPPGTMLIWDWTNADEWQDILSMTSDTLLITFEVVDFHDIEYRSLLPDMPERWKRMYVTRIIDALAL